MTAFIPAQRTPDPAERWHLVTAAQAGDRDAFGRLFEAYRATVYGVIYRRVHNPTLAEDLTQDVFLRALRSIGTVQWQGRDIGAWLTTIARNIAVDHFKSGRFRYEHLSSVNAPSTGEDPDLDRRSDPELVAVHNNLAGILSAALAELTAEQREVLALRFGAGLSVSETARAMGRHEGAVKALQYRATRAAARLLARAGVTS